MTLLPSSKSKLEMLGRMAAGIAHDFNNLLAIIEGYAGMMQRQAQDQGQKEKLQAILIATQRGGSLTRKLMEFEQDKPASDGTCNLVAVVEENKVLMKPVLSSRIELVTHLPASALRVALDGDFLIQLMIAFGMSARARQSDQLTIAVSATGDRAFLVFRDSSAKRLREDEATAHDINTMTEIIQSCGGKVALYELPERGNELTISLPLVRQRAELADKTVLIVDDEEEILPALEEQLHHMGMKVLKAANADSALRLHQRHQEKIDFLLTDVVMPKTNGVVLAEMITEHAPHMGVVYMTGYPDRPETEHLPASALVVPKPLRPETLSFALQQALSRVRDA